MSLKEKIENNWMVVLICAAVAVGSTTFGVTKYFHDEETAELIAENRIDVKKVESQTAAQIDTLKRAQAAEIERLTTMVSSINRRLGGETYFDVRGIFKSSDQINTGAVRYVSDGKFFCEKDSPAWSYEKSSELRLISEITGNEFTKTLTPGEQEAFDKMAVAYLWRGQDQYVIEGSALKKMFPFIMLEVFSEDQLQKIFGAIARSPVEDAPETTALPQKAAGNTSTTVNSIEGLFHADAATFMLTGILTSAIGLSTADPSVSILFKTVQKVGPVLYLQDVLKVHDRTINDKPSSDLYVVQEIFLISRSEGLVMIKTNIPVTVPVFSGGLFTEVNGWLADFHLSEY